MTFTIFKKTGERHFELGGIDDYDGDVGYEQEINVPDAQVKKTVEDLIITDYFRDIRERENSSQIANAVHKLMGDLDMYDAAIEIYGDELRRQYEEEYNRG